MSRRLIVCLLLLTGLAACSTDTTRHPPPGQLPDGAGGHHKTGAPYQVDGRWYTPMPQAGHYDEQGIASWYGRDFHGRLTANGERYDMHAFSAAHKTLPLPTLVRVTNLENGRSVVVRVNDRGPFVKDRLIDLSYAAARALGFADRGTARVRVQTLDQPATDAVKTKTSTQTHYVQVGAFSSRAHAQALEQRLQPHFPAIHVQYGNDLYRVRIGPLADQDQIERLIGQLRQQGIRQSIVVSEP